MKASRTKRALLLAATAALCAASAACKDESRTGAVPTPSPAAPNATASASPEATPPPNNPDVSSDAALVRSTKPPAPSEARAAVERVYKNAVLVDASRPPVVGDFNGDGSEDIAVAVRPVESKLDDINSEFANWIVEDPKRYGAPAQPRAGAAPAANATPAPQAGPPKVSRRDTLLVIIHGHGPAGWRDADATQSYLLLNAAGEEMRAYPLKGFPPAIKVISNGANSRADVLSEKLSGTAGFLYWGAGKYAWHEQ